MTRDVFRLALDVFVERLDAESHLPEPARRKAARAAAERVLDAHEKGGSPAAMAWIERKRERTHVDELLAARARPILERVAREASAATGGDVTPGLLIKRAGRGWLTEWRDLACWRLAAELDETQERVGAVMGGRSRVAVSQAIARCAARAVGDVGAADVKRAKGAT